MASIFEQRSQELGMHQPRTQGSGSVFERRANETGQGEGKLKSAARTVLQIPAGIAQLAIWPADVAELGRRGGIALIRKVLGDEIADEVEASGVLPKTQHEAEQLIEEKTGLPLEAKTPVQKGVRLGSMAGGGLPGTLAQRGAYALGAGGVSESLKALGVPETISEGAGLLSVRPAEGAQRMLAPALPKIGKERKPSGLTTRRYENLKEPRAVPGGKKAQIEAKVENEFRGISDKIIQESPIFETYSSLKKDSGFKEAASQAFRDVEALSEQVPGSLSTQDLKKNIVDKVLKKKGTGFTPSEYDTAHKKFIAQFLKNTPTQEIKAKDLVTQFRKNNEALREAYEPGQSFAYNRGKREALQDYNRTIAEMIEQQYPGTEFADLFKSSNEQWSKIMDAEAIDKFIDGLFNGKIRFEKGKQLFDKAGMTVPFKRALGPEGFKQFMQLNKDLLSTEQANKMLRVAAKQGFGDKLSTLAAYVMHPKVGYAKAGFDLAKGSYKKMVEFLLDKPQYAITWETGVKAFKKGDFKTATQAFQVLEAEQAKAAKEAVKPPMKAKEPLTIEAKVEPVRPKEENPLFQESPKKAAETPKTEMEMLGDLGKGMASGITDNFYEGIFKSLQEGKSTFSGVKDPLIAKAKPYFDQRLIKSSKDLHAFANDPKGFLDSTIPEVPLEMQRSSAPPAPKKRESSLQKEYKKQAAEREKKAQAGLDKASKRKIADFKKKAKSGSSLYPKELMEEAIEREKAAKAPKKTKREALEEGLEAAKENLKKRKDQLESSEHPQIKRERKKLVEAAEQRIKDIEEAIEEIEGKEFRDRFMAKKDVKVLDPRDAAVRAEVPTKQEAKIDKMERQDISKKGLKEQKQFLIEELDKAIKVSSDTNELLTFKVPGDGTFKIKNHKKALQAFRKSVEKRWPDKPLKLSEKDLQVHKHRKNKLEKARESINERKEFEEYIKKYGTRG